MTRTKGNVIIENIQIGDIHYEFELGYCVKVEVLSLPVSEQQEDGIMWRWQSKKCSDPSVIVNYAVHSKYQHYSANLYDYEAYAGCKMI